MAMPEEDYALFVSCSFCFSLTYFKDGYSFKYGTCKSPNFFVKKEKMKNLKVANKLLTFLENIMFFAFNKQILNVLLTHVTFVFFFFSCGFSF